MSVDRRKRNEVRGILAQLEASGLSQREFAEREGISASTLAYWIRREKVENKLRQDSELVEVVAPAASEDNSATFTAIFGEVRIEIPRDATAEEWQLLREVWAS